MKLFFSLTFLLFVLSSFSISTEDKSRMNEETENWIDDIPLGLQDRLSDAVVHAQRGFFNEINYFRSISDTIGSYKYQVEITDTTCGKNQDIRVRIYSPDKATFEENYPVLIYFHGGGWNLGSIGISDKFCRALAAEGKICIYSIDYPLAPEHKYPAAINVCLDAVTSISRNLKESHNFSLGGDGAGGNLAFETFLAISKDQNTIPKINSIIAYYPLIHTSGNLSEKSKKLYGRNYGFDSRVWEAFIDSYAGSAGNLIEKQISNLPSTLIISAGKDIIQDQILEFTENNSQIELITFDDSLHGFITDGHQPTAFNLAVSITSQFLNRQNH